MKSPLIIALAAFVLGTHFRAHAGDGVVDLTNLATYANQPRPAYITKNNTPPNNQISNAGATLGRILFYDKRLSRNNTVACGSCHQRAHAFSDPLTASNGVSGTTARHTMRLINARFGTEQKFFWDERAATLEAQTTQPIQNHTEMGFSGTSGDPGLTDLLTKLSAISEYRVLFTMIFGDSGITEARLELALAQFVRSIQSFDSRYDTGRAQAGNDGAPFADFTAQENAGKALFLTGPGQGGAGCAACHRPPEFDIDPNSLNNGTTTVIGGGTDLTVTRAPSLRDLVDATGQPHGGFMHDASLTTLAAVIDHYNVIPADNTNLDPRLRPGGRTQRLNLTQPQKDNLAAFLATLTGTNVYTDPRWSDPFDANGNLSLIVLPASSVSIVNNGDGTATVSAKVAASLNYQLMSSTDLVNWTTVATLRASAGGSVTRTVNVANRVFYRYAYTPPAS